MAKTRHAFANEEGQVRVTCPECSAIIDLEISSDVKDDDHLQTSCQSCQAPLTVLVERRHHVRLDKLLPGLFWRPSEDKKHAMVVEDISIAGIRFAMEEPLDLQVGDRLEVEYMHYGEKLGSCVQIRSIKGHMVGGLFASQCVDQKH